MDRKLLNITLLMEVLQFDYKHTTNGQLTRIKRIFESHKLIIKAFNDVGHDHPRLNFDENIINLIGPVLYLFQFLSLTF